MRLRQGIGKFAERHLGRILSVRQRKMLRYQLIRAKEAVGIDHFTGLDDLDRKLLPHIGDIADGIFIEAGANDGINQSNTWHLERRLGWRGLLIEPVPEIADLCRRFRTSQVECTALGDFEQEGSTVTMHFGGLMTAAEDAEASHMRGGDAQSHAQIGIGWSGGQSYSFESRVAALSTLIDRAHLPKVDLLSLDVEGFEVNVLNGIDFARHPIRYILVETSNIDAVRAVLDAHYELVEQPSHHDYLFRHRAADIMTAAAGGGTARRSTPGGAPGSGLFFLFEGHRDVGVGGQADLVALDTRDQAGRDEVVVPGMRALPLGDVGTRILLGQLDAVALDLVDGADMDAVGADDFHMFLDLAGVGHGIAPWLMVPDAKRTPAGVVA